MKRDALRDTVQMTDGKEETDVYWLFPPQAAHIYRMVNTFATYIQTGSIVRIKFIEYQSYRISKEKEMTQISGDKIEQDEEVSQWVEGG